MWKGSCIRVASSELVRPAFMSSQNASPRQITRLAVGATLSEPQLEHAKSLESFPQSGQLVELIVQKKRIERLASRSDTRRQRARTTSPRSLIVAVGFNQVGTNSGRTLKIFRNR